MSGEENTWVKGGEVSDSKVILYSLYGRHCVRVWKYSDILTLMEHMLNAKYNAYLFWGAYLGQTLI